MVEPYRRRSALAHFGLAARAGGGGQDRAEIILGEDAHRSLLNIRGDAADSPWCAAVASVINAEPPTRANTVREAGDRRILWLGPNEWLIVAPDGEASALVTALRQGFSGRHASVVDVSETRTIVTLAGPRSRELLARGISLDLHPRVFPTGQCAETGMSRCNVLLHLVDERPSFDLYVLKSFADYLWRWIELAGADFRIAVAV